MQQKVMHHASIMSVSIDKGYLITAANYMVSLWKIEKSNNEYNLKRLLKFEEMHIRRFALNIQDRSENFFYLKNCPYEGSTKTN